MSSKAHLLSTIESAQKEFRLRLDQIDREGGIKKPQYAAYVEMQYHLTKGVQRHFLIAASHPDLAQRRGLRKFLVGFANEEELHYELALKDLENLGQTPGKTPFSVELWWTYFNSIIHERPFVRLGAACILETIAEPSKALVQKLLGQCPFINEKNSRFLVLHQHGEALPHGEEILKALDDGQLTPQLWNDLVEGAEKGTALYLQMADEALGFRPLTPKR